MAALRAGANGRGRRSQAGDLSKPRPFPGRDLGVGGAGGEGEGGRGDGVAGEAALSRGSAGGKLGRRGGSYVSPRMGETPRVSRPYTAVFVWRGWDPPRAAGAADGPGQLAAALRAAAVVWAPPLCRGAHVVSLSRHELCVARWPYEGSCSGNLWIRPATHRGEPLAISNADAQAATLAAPHVPGPRRAEEGV